MDDYQRICLQSLDRLLATFIRESIIVVISVCFAYFGAFYVNFARGQRDTLFAFKFYGVEDGSDIEYFLNLSFQLFFALYFIVANIVLETGVGYYENNIFISTDIIKMEIQQLSGNLESERLDESEMKKRLIHILLKFQYCNQWMQDYDKILYWRYFLSPVVFTYSIALCVFAQFSVSFRKSIQWIDYFSNNEFSCLWKLVAV